mmetsp:Transcript_62228/g.158236  ORF Transcript_62228/g.158236 Transcript_62228/m.158236 type:complete len:361 (+) Transcript_62228:523-1605(+)
MVLRRCKMCHDQQRNLHQPWRPGKSPHLPHNFSVEVALEGEALAQRFVAMGVNELVRQCLRCRYPRRWFEHQHVLQQVARNVREATDLQRFAFLQSLLCEARRADHFFLLRVVARQKQHPCQRDEEDHAETPNVDGGGPLATQHHLGRHIVGRADDLLILFLRQKSGGQAEVDQLHRLVAPRHHEVLRVQISVDEAVRVATQNGLEALPQDHRHSTLRNESRAIGICRICVLNDVCEQVGSCTQLHHDEVFVDLLEMLNHLYNVRVVEVDESSELPIEVFGQCFHLRELFDGTMYARVDVQGLMHPSKGPLSNALFEQILVLDIPLVLPHHIHAQKLGLWSILAAAVWPHLKQTGASPAL